MSARVVRSLSAMALAAGSLGAVGVIATSQPASAATGSYYLALGDSLGAGYQPGLGDNKTGGYVGAVLAHLKQTDPSVELNNLSCSGETTGTMLKGGICTYPQGNQLAAGVAFAKAHKNELSLITIDIGANDIDSCATTTGVDFTCLAKGLATVNTQLPQILGQLRAAAPNARLVVVNYYNPFLAAWLTGTSGQTLAKTSVTLADTFDGEIASAAAGVKAPVADVQTAFSSSDFTPTVTVKPYGSLPLNVARICQWTWMCSKDNIHANDAGYAVMGKAVIAAIPAAPPTSSPSSSPSASTTTATGVSSSPVSGPPVVTDGPASGGNESVLVAAGAAAVAVSALGGAAAMRIRRRRDGGRS